MVKGVPRSTSECSTLKVLNMNILRKGVFFEKKSLNFIPISSQPVHVYFIKIHAHMENIAHQMVFQCICI